jgi:hypothetical protein
MKRRVPTLTSDEAAEAFLESDLSDLDFSQFRSGRLRFGKQSTPAHGASEIYRLFERAIIERKQIVCTYNGERREVCPIMLGHSQGEERALTYQFAGESASRKLPPEGDWRCLTLSNVSDVELREGPWYSGHSHNQPSGCVQVLDLDDNTASPYNPKRRVADLRNNATAGKTATIPTSDRKKPRQRAE